MNIQHNMIIGYTVNIGSGKRLGVELLITVKMPPSLTGGGILTVLSKVIGLRH